MQSDSRDGWQAAFVFISNAKVLLFFDMCKFFGQKMLIIRHFCKQKRYFNIAIFAIYEVPCVDHTLIFCSFSLEVVLFFFSTHFCFGFL